MAKTSVTDLILTAARLGLEGQEILLDFSVPELERIYNGIGPDRFPDWLRQIITDANGLFEPAALIHDVRYHVGGTIEDFTAANDEFHRNCNTLVCARFAWYDPRRYLWEFRAWRYTKGFKGIAHWFKVQFLEEQAHAAIMINYMHSQDAKVILAPIAKVQTEWKTVLAAFEDTLAHEKKVTAMINNLCDIADEDKDRAAGNFLAWFIDEQVEEEENARDLVNQCKMIGDHIGGMIMLDKELGAREYHTPSPLK